jgi:truncated hemoglobin YjbI
MTGTSALHPRQRVHARAHLGPAHFDRWLALWCAAVDDRYAGPTAELAKLQATRRRCHESPNRRAGTGARRCDARAGRSAVRHTPVAAR